MGINQAEKEVFLECLHTYASSNVGKITMTLAECFEKDGLEKGLEKGRRKAHKLLYAF